MSIKKQEDEHQHLETLSDRLLYALETQHVTQAELARKIKVKPQIINYLCKSKTRKSQLTYDIADALCISSEWLANNVGFMKQEDDPHYKLVSMQNQVPLFTSDQIKLHCQRHFKYFHDEKVSNWLLTMADTGKNGFALEIQDKSMYPRFDQRTIIIINTDKKPQNKGFVLAYIKSIDDLIFRQIEFRDEGIILEPMNTAMYKPITLDKNDQIIGTLAEARWQT